VSWRTLRLLCAASLLGSCLVAGRAAAAGPRAGEPAKSFELVDATGTKVRLVDLRGKVVLLDFWASWCEPCLKELPELEKLHQRLASKGVVVVGVNIDNQRQNAQALMAKFKLTFKVLLDPAGKVVELYDPPKMPTSYVIDADGVVRYVSEGFSGAADVQKLEQQLQQQLERRGTSPVDPGALKPVPPMPLQPPPT